MSEVGIKEPEKLISPILGGNKKVTDVKISRLTEPGENNLSLVLKVDYVIENGNGTKKELYGVAKVKPIGDFVFGHQQNYKNELAFYNIVVPTLQDFQRQQGVDDVMDIFAKLHAFRPNFHGKNDEIDDDSVIMLENLIELGYENIDRLVGFDLELTKLILKDLALLHGVPLALRRLQPEVYREKIASNFAKFDLLPDDGPPPDMPNPFPILMEILGDNKEFADLLPIIKEKMKFMGFNGEPEGPFSTLSHGDLWVNNIMTKFENGKPVKNKIVDFQMYVEFSVAKDLLFFLFTSVQQEVLEESFDDLLRFYYDSLIEVVEQHKCETSQLTLEKFLDDVARIAKTELEHVMVMTYFVVFGKKGREDTPMAFLNKANVTPEGKRRGKYVINEFNKRGWLS